MMASLTLQAVLPEHTAGSCSTLRSVPAELFPACLIVRDSSFPGAGLSISLI